MAAGSLIHDLDPEMAEALAVCKRLSRRQGPDADIPLAELRALYREERAPWNGYPAVAAIRETALRGPAGDVGLRLYHPRPGTRLPVVVYLHGGGWVMGDLDTHDHLMRSLACEAGAAVVGVDYHLAPGVKFPLQIEETLATLGALPSLAADWELRSGAPVLAGDSAGAQIALGSALDAAAGTLAGLVLFYGAFGLSDSRSHRVFAGAPYGLPPGDLAFYRDSLIRSEADLADPRLDLLSADLSRLPPAFVGAAGLDPFLDDSLALAERLGLAGRPVALQVYPGLVHGFLHYARMVGAARRAFAEAGAWIQDRA